MNPFQKIAAAIGGIGVLALAIWLGTIIFILLLIAAPLLYLYGRWKMGKMRKEFEAQNPELAEQLRQRQGMRPKGGDVIDGEYVVIEEPLDEKRPPRA
jgi:predicted Holliday junction resolvase-like endonuclease